MITLVSNSHRLLTNVSYYFYHPPGNLGTSDSIYLLPTKRVWLVMIVEATMPQRLYCFWRDDNGQDIVEYSLLICFIAIATMWIMGSGQPVVNQIWTTANSTVTNAHAAAGG